MFNFIKEKLSKVYTTFTQQISSLFYGNDRSLDETVKELEKLFIQADTGVQTTKEITQKFRAAALAVNESDRNLQKILTTILHDFVADISHKQSSEYAPVIIMVGVNGSGKTTTIGKIAHQLASSGKRVLLVAADTFRAGAAAQLAEWKRHDAITVLLGNQKQEPASLIFDGCTQFVHEQYDHILIDTAGRLQTKVNLMSELEKVFRIIDKKLPDVPRECLLTIDAMLGQNALAQAEKFSDSAPVTGIVLTKFDGTGKGGIIFAITQQLGLPVNLVTFGESVDDIKRFNYGEYINDLLDSYES